MISICFLRLWCSDTTNDAPCERCHLELWTAALQELLATCGTYTATNKVDSCSEASTSDKFQPKERMVGQREVARTHRGALWVFGACANHAEGTGEVRHTSKLLEVCCFSSWNPSNVFWTAGDH